MRATNISVNGLVLNDKAEQIAYNCCLRNPGFTTSNVWMDCSKIKYGLFEKTICGESAGVISKNVQEWYEKNYIL